MGGQGLEIGCRRNNLQVFQKSGNPHSDVDVVSSGLEEDDDPFSECDLQQEMESLIHKTTPADGRCTLKEYIWKEIMNCKCV